MNKSLKQIAIVFLLLVLIFSGCDQIFSQQPKVNDLIGTYHLTSDTEKFLVKRKGYKSIPECLIELRPDYSISIKNLPNCDGFGECDGTFVMGDGKWEIEKVFMDYGLTINIDKGGTLKEGWYIRWIGILRRSPPYILEIMFGDPDSAERIQYEKV